MASQFVSCFSPVGTSHRPLARCLSISSHNDACCYFLAVPQSHLPVFWNELGLPDAVALQGNGSELQNHVDNNFTPLCKPSSGFHRRLEGHSPAVSTPSSEKQWEGCPSRNSTAYHKHDIVQFCRRHCAIMDIVHSCGPHLLNMP